MNLHLAQYKWLYSTPNKSAATVWTHLSISNIDFVTLWTILICSYYFSSEGFKYSIFRGRIIIFFKLY